MTVAFFYADNTKFAADSYIRNIGIDKAEQRNNK